MADTIRLDDGYDLDVLEDNGGPAGYNPTFTTTTLPAASAHTGYSIYVSNAAGGAILAFSDGTNWRRCDDRAIVS